MVDIFDIVLCLVVGTIGKPLLRHRDDFIHCMDREAVASLSLSKLLFTDIPCQTHLYAVGVMGFNLYYYIHVKRTILTLDQEKRYTCPITHTRVPCDFSGGTLWCLQAYCMLYYNRTIGTHWDLSTSGREHWDNITTSWKRWVLDAAHCTVLPMVHKCWTLHSTARVLGT